MDRCSPSARASSMDCMGTMTSPARWRRDPRDDVISRVRHGQQQYTSTTTAPIKTRTAPMTTPVIRDKNWYRDGPHMVAKIFMIGIKYACNKNINENLIWMQSQFQRTLNMLAISNSKRTLYACNLFQKGPNMLAIIKNYFREIRLEIMVTWLRYNFWHCKHIWSLLQAIAIIKSPF